MRYATALLLAAAALAPAASYEIDNSHSSAQFSVRHLMVSNVRGEFSKVTGSVEFDSKDLSKSTVRAVIDANTINTRDEKRDAHLRSADFFDVARFPTLTFVSKKFASSGPSKYKVTGDLTLHGVTREVTLDVDGPTPEVKDPWGNLRIGASATAKIKRSDFGLTWNKALEAGGVLVGEEVTITIDVELKKSNAAVSDARRP